MERKKKVDISAPKSEVFIILNVNLNNSTETTFDINFRRIIISKLASSFSSSKLLDDSNTFMNGSKFFSGRYYKGFF